jgi:hypothetical protein
MVNSKFMNGGRHEHDSVLSERGMDAQPTGVFAIEAFYGKYRG